MNDVSGAQITRGARLELRPLREPHRGDRAAAVPDDDAPRPRAQRPARIHDERQPRPLPAHVRVRHVRRPRVVARSVERVAEPRVEVALPRRRASAAGEDDDGRPRRRGGGHRGGRRDATRRGGWSRGGRARRLIDLADGDARKSTAASMMPRDDRVFKKNDGRPSSERRPPSRL